MIHIFENNVYNHIPKWTNLVSDSNWCSRYNSHLIEIVMSRVQLLDKYSYNPWPFFTKQRDVWLQDLVKFRSREIGCYNDRIALKFDKRLGSTAVEMSIKFQSDWTCLNPNLVASRLHEVLPQDARPLSE